MSLEHTCGRLGTKSSKKKKAPLLVVSAVFSAVSALALLARPLRCISQWRSGHFVEQPFTMDCRPVAWGAQRGSSRACSGIVSRLPECARASPHFPQFCVRCSPRFQWRGDFLNLYFSGFNSPLDQRHVCSVTHKNKGDSRSAVTVRDDGFLGIFSDETVSCWIASSSWQSSVGKTM